MSAVVKRALPLLKVLADAKPKLKKAIIQHAPAELVTAISEIVLNLIKGVIKLTASQKKRLSRYKKDLLALAKKKLSIGKKKKILVQKGGSAAVSILVIVAIVIVGKIKMKRMVLIPEEKLLRYEEQLNDQPPTNEQAGGSIFTGGFRPPIHYPGGNYPGHDYLYNYPKYPGSMIVRGEDEESMSIEMIVRSIPKSMKKRAEALLAHLKEREDVITWDDMGQVLVDGVLIPRSNITDLVSDAMRSRKNFNPIGVHEFYSVLNKINVPKDLVRNERRWDEPGKNVDEKTKELMIPEWISF